MSTDASTGATSTGSASTGGSTMAAMVGWGDDWRQRMVAGTTDPEKELNQIQRYESPEQVWRKARELERRMSAGELRSTLRKDATSEEASRWRQENGVPVKPDDYKINMPEGKEPPPEDDKFLNAVRKTAFDENVPQATFDKLIETFYGQLDVIQAEMSESEKQLVQKVDDQLHKEWGADYRPNKNMVEALLARAPQGFRDAFLNGKLADGTPIQASVEAWKWLVQLEREINPAATVVPGAGGDLGKTIETEITELEGLMGNRNSKYWKGPEADKLQARYRELVAARDKLKAKSAA